MQRRQFLRAALLASSMHAGASQGLVAAPPDANRQRVGIAFGGGSLHGVAHVGVLKALREKGVKFDFIAGTSAGAIIGVLAAAQLPVGEIDKIARGIGWPSLSSLIWPGKGLMRNSNLRRAIDAALGNRTIEQLAIPFGAIATDIASGARVIVRRGSAAAAVDASCSIPVLFAPVKIDGRELIDGGLTEPVPVIAVREMGATLVIGVDVLFRPNEGEIKGMGGVLFQTMQIMGNALANAQIGHADVVIRMNLHSLVGKQDTHEQLVAAGYAAAMRAWPKLHARLSRSAALEQVFC